MKKKAYLAQVLSLTVLEAITENLCHQNRTWPTYKFSHAVWVRSVMWAFHPYIPNTDNRIFHVQSQSSSLHIFSMERVSVKKPNIYCKAKNKPQKIAPFPRHIFTNGLSLNFQTNRHTNF